jgi:hypothetical protein
MAATFPLSFRNDTLRKHRRSILFEREKALLPAMQVFVGYWKNIKKYEEEIAQIRAIYGDPAIRVPTAEEEQTLCWRFKILRTEYHSIRNQRVVLKTAIEGEKKGGNDPEKIARLRTSRLELKKRLLEIEEPYHKMKEEWMAMSEKLNTAIHNMYHNRQLYDGSEGGPARREFVMKCGDENCRGFLSSAYKCGTCEKWTCSDCLVVIGPEKDAAHTCNPDTVETAKMIKADTRPCPKCGARISKIDGCDQMYCVVEGCQTAFSWITGHIVTGKIHNPHYYEWLKRTGGGIDRETGDIPCGGLPHAHQMIETIRAANIPSDTKNTVYNTHRGLRELIDYRLGDFPARPAALANKDLNVRYLMNLISEDEWKRQLEIAEARFQRKKEIGQILQTIATAGSDAMNQIVNEFRVQEPHVFAVWVSTTAMEELERLRIFGNDSLRALAKRDRIAVPQFDAVWSWMPLRAIYKPAKPAETSA